MASWLDGERGLKVERSREDIHTETGEASSLSLPPSLYLVRTERPDQPPAPPLTDQSNILLKHSINSSLRYLVRDNVKEICQVCHNTSR